MKIIADLNKMQINGMKIEVSHKNETIYFNFAIFNKNNFLNDNLVFKHLNAYWEYKGEYFQEQVFKLYKDWRVLNKAPVSKRATFFDRVRTWVQNQRYGSYVDRRNLKEFYNGEWKRHNYRNLIFGYTIAGTR